MKQSPPWRAKLELALCKLGLLAVPPLPRRMVVALAHTIAAVAWLVARRERRIGLANLDLAYGATLTPAAKRAILRESFYTFALLLLDVFWFSAFDEAWKVGAEGDVGAYWGLWDRHGRIKFP